MLLISFSGYLYNYQTKEFYNLSYATELPEGSAKFGGLLTFALYLQLYVFLTICLYDLKMQFCFYMLLTVFSDEVVVYGLEGSCEYHVHV